MKREYQIRALIDEGGHMREVGKGEAADVWGLYKRDVGAAEWIWMADFGEEALARETLAEFEAGEKAEEIAADLLTIEERNCLWDALKEAEDDCNAVRLCLGLTTLAASAVLLDEAAKSLADAQAIIDAAEERAEKREDWQ